MRVHAEVAEALAARAPVVALESTIIAHGLPWPENLEVARQIEAVVREEGAVPATIAVVEGMVRIGLDREGLEAIADAGPFFYAEDYHQQYLAKNPNGYCGLGGTGVSCPIGLSA